MAEWIVFDVDQTLCDFDRVMRRALARTGEEIGRRWPVVGELGVDRLKQVRDAVAARDRTGASLKEVRRLSFAAALSGVADDQEVQSITDFYLRERYADPIVFDDVRPALETCRAAGLGLATLSNGNSHLADLGLSGLVEYEFAAEVIGLAKPDPAVFDHVVEQVGSVPEQMIMVGDSYTHDVSGARAAGWRALLLDRDGISEPGECISTLAELPRVI